jgi:hypothetical protein
LLRNKVKHFTFVHLGEHWTDDGPLVKRRAATRDLFRSGVAPGSQPGAGFGGWPSIARPGEDGVPIILGESRDGLSSKPMTARRASALGDASPTRRRTMRRSVHPATLRRTWAVSRPGKPL